MLRKKFLRHNTSYNEFRYKSEKREHQKLVRRDKTNYYKNKIDNSNGDSGNLWRIINDLLMSECHIK